MEESKKAHVLLPNGKEVSAEYLQSFVNDARQREWIFTIWRTKSALVDKEGKHMIEYVGQVYDHDRYQLVENGWSFDLCEICEKAISNSNKDEYENAESKAYTDGTNWICQSCYQHFISTDNTKKTIEA